MSFDRSLLETNYSDDLLSTKDVNVAFDMPDNGSKRSHYVINVVGNRREVICSLEMPIVDAFRQETLLDWKKIVITELVNTFDIAQGALKPEVIKRLSVRDVSEEKNSNSYSTTAVKAGAPKVYKVDKDPVKVNPNQVLSFRVSGIATAIIAKGAFKYVPVEKWSLLMVSAYFHEFGETWKPESGDNSFLEIICPGDRVKAIRLVKEYFYALALLINPVKLSGTTDTKRDSKNGKALISAVTNMSSKDEKTSLIVPREFTSLDSIFSTMPIKLRRSFCDGINQLVRPGITVPLATIFPERIKQLLTIEDTPYLCGIAQSGFYLLNTSHPLSNVLYFPHANVMDVVASQNGKKFVSVSYKPNARADSVLKVWDVTPIDQPLVNAEAATATPKLLHAQPYHDVAMAGRVKLSVSPTGRYILMFGQVPIEAGQCQTANGRPHLMFTKIFDAETGTLTDAGRVVGKFNEDAFFLSADEFGVMYPGSFSVFKITERGVVESQKVLQFPAELNARYIIWVGCASLGRDKFFTLGAYRDNTRQMHLRGILWNIQYKDGKYSFAIQNIYEQDHFLSIYFTRFNHTHFHAVSFNSNKLIAINHDDGSVERLPPLHSYFKIGDGADRRTVQFTDGRPFVFNATDQTVVISDRSMQLHRRNDAEPLKEFLPRDLLQIVAGYTSEAAGIYDTSEFHRVITSLPERRLSQIATQFTITRDFRSVEAFKTFIPLSHPEIGQPTRLTLDTLKANLKDYYQLVLKFCPNDNSNGLNTLMYLLIALTMGEAVHINAVQRIHAFEEKTRNEFKAKGLTLFKTYQQHVGASSDINFLGRVVETALREKLYSIGLVNNATSHDFHYVYIKSHEDLNNLPLSVYKDLLIKAIKEQLNVTLTADEILSLKCRQNESEFNADVATSITDENAKVPAQENSIMTVRLKPEAAFRLSIPLLGMLPIQRWQPELVASCFCRMAVKFSDSAMKDYCIQISKEVLGVAGKHAKERIVNRNKNVPNWRSESIYPNNLLVNGSNLLAAISLYANHTKPVSTAVGVSSDNPFEMIFEKLKISKENILKLIAEFKKQFIIPIQADEKTIVSSNQPELTMPGYFNDFITMSNALKEVSLHAFRLSNGDPTNAQISMTAVELLKAMGIKSVFTTVVGPEMAASYGFQRGKGWNLGEQLTERLAGPEYDRANYTILSLPTSFGRHPVAVVIDKANRKIHCFDSDGDALQAQTEARIKLIGAARVAPQLIGYVVVNYPKLGQQMKSNNSCLLTIPNIMGIVLGIEGRVLSDAKNTYKGKQLIRPVNSVTGVGLEPRSDEELKVWLGVLISITEKLEADDQLNKKAVKAFGK